MYEIDVAYNGSFNYAVKSLGYEVKIDFPKDGGGPMEGITPPALLLASMGSCLAVYVEKYLTQAKIKFDKFSINVKSDICSDMPRYLKKIEVGLDIQGAGLDVRRKDALLEFIKNCPVHNTLMNKPEVSVLLVEKA